MSRTDTAIRNMAAAFCANQPQHMELYVAALEAIADLARAELIADIQRAETEIRH